MAPTESSLPVRFAEPCQSFATHPFFVAFVFFVVKPFFQIEVKCARAAHSDQSCPEAPRRGERSRRDAGRSP